MEEIKDYDGEVAWQFAVYFEILWRRGTSVRRFPYFRIINIG